MKKVLIVTTNTSDIDGKYSVGADFDEFKHFYLMCEKTGYGVTVASPAGGNVSAKTESVEDNSDEYMSFLKDTTKLSDIDPQEYDCILIPGCAGAMFDLADNQDLAGIIETLKHNRKVIGAIGFGVSGLIGAEETDGRPYVKGKALTSVSQKDEESRAFAQFLPFSPEQKLKELGANFMSKDPKESFVVEDDYLITGQNKNSIEEFVQKVSQKLERLDKRRG